MYMFAKMTTMFFFYYLQVHVGCFQLGTLPCDRPGWKSSHLWRRLAESKHLVFTKSGSTTRRFAAVLPSTSITSCATVKYIFFKPDHSFNNNTVVRQPSCTRCRIVMQDRKNGLSFLFQVILLSSRSIASASTFKKMYMYSSCKETLLTFRNGGNSPCLHIHQVSKSEIQKTSLIWRHSAQAAEINTSL